MMQLSTIYNPEAAPGSGVEKEERGKGGSWSEIIISKCGRGHGEEKAR